MVRDANPVIITIDAPGVQEVPCSPVGRPFDGDGRSSAEAAANGSRRSVTGALLMRRRSLSNQSP
jgi:hypothetical protein